LEGEPGSEWSPVPREKVVGTSEDGEDLSVDGLTKDYLLNCADRKWEPTPIKTKQGELKDVMLELFGSSQSGSVERDGKSVRGYRRVRWRTADDDPDE